MMFTWNVLQFYLWIIPQESWKRKKKCIPGWFPSSCHKWVLFLCFAECVRIPWGRGGMHCDPNLCFVFYSAIYLVSLRAKEASVSSLGWGQAHRPQVAPETDKWNSLSSLFSSLVQQPSGSYIAVHALETSHGVAERMRAQVFNSDEPGFRSWLCCSTMGWPRATCMPQLPQNSVLLSVCKALNSP